jgi:hypothetical protein
VIIVYACAAVFVVLAALLRGRLARLATLRLRRVWLVWVALAVQVLVISVLPARGHTALDVVNYATYGCAAAFAWANRRVAGAWPIFVGGAANIAAITANGGVMPARRSALVASGWQPPRGHFANSAVVAHAHLAVLGDVFATPRWLPGHDVFSIGDVLIVVGVATVVWLTCAEPADGSAARAPEPAREDTDRYGRRWAINHAFPAARPDRPGS